MSLPTVALSLRQPWASIVLYLGKRIENRRWNTSFRGEFWIHAAKGMTNDEYESALEFAADALEMAKPILSYLDMKGVLAKDQLKRGGIVGRARLVGVIPPCTTGLFGGCEHTWHMPAQYGFVLEDVKAVAFVPMTGALGFHHVPKSVLEQLEKAETP